MEQVLFRPRILAGSGGQGPAEMPGAGRDPEGPVEIQLSLRLSVSQTITNRLHYSHSDFNKTTKQSQGLQAESRRRAAAAPSACLFHNPKKEKKRVRPPLWIILVLHA
jgi:hypothetical protein